MNPNQPIEIRDGYRQDGERIEPKSMVEALEREPDAAPAVQRSRAFGTVATVLGALGGALVGWPLGEMAAGSSKPLWALAAVGGGAIVVAIPLAIGADSSMDSAVRSHNDRVAANRPESRQRDPAESLRYHRLRPPPAVERERPPAPNPDPTETPAPDSE